MSSVSLVDRNMQKKTDLRIGANLCQTLFHLVSEAEFYLYAEMKKKIWIRIPNCTSRDHFILLGSICILSIMQ